MGCSGSKDSTTKQNELAADFFGDTAPGHQQFQQQQQQHSTHQQSPPSPPFAAQQQQQQKWDRPEPAHSQNTSQKFQQQKQYSANKLQEERAISPPSVSVTTSGKITTNKPPPPAKSPKRYVAPPSSESFSNEAAKMNKVYASPSIAMAAASAANGGLHPNQQPRKQQQQQQQLAPKTQPPPKKQKAPIQLDEDDFSLAPSLDLQVRHIEKTTFDDIYERGKKLGFGAFAVVFIGKHKPTGATYAIKQVDRSKMFWGDRDALQDEIRNLKALREGPNIVQLYEVFEEKTFCYLVTELMNGGELFDRIIEKKTFSESEARNCCRCVLSALEYMHERRVAHRDLKPENLLLAHQKRLLPVKLADFGFAKAVKAKNGCRTLCGTPGYLAPEILERWPSYDVKCDIWSVGVILFLLLGGYLPFDDEDEDKVFDRTRNGSYDFRPQFWRNISSGAKDLVTQCLTINPNKRVNATQALKHDWMVVGEAELAGNQVDVDKMKHALEGRKKMRAAINTLVAANRLKQLNDDFTTYLDKNREKSMVSHFSLMTGGTRTVATQFEEDSPSGKPFHAFYEMGELLGEGGFANVYRCKRKRTKLTYAVKHVMVNKLERGGALTLRDEISALKLLRGGPHIVRLFDVFDNDPDNTYLILEECKGGHLLARIVEKEVYTEREARHVCQILFQAINYCHKKHIAHRDIKPENMLLVEENDDTSVKIADFGFAKKVTGRNSLKTICGTPLYVAPEILDTKVDGYDNRCDLWSAGIVAYLLLGGYVPFDGPLENISADIIKGEYEFHEEYWSVISGSAKDMIQSLLQVNPDNRATAQQALGCSWMEVEEESLTVRDLSKTQMQLKNSIAVSTKPAAKVQMAVQAMLISNKWLSLAGVANRVVKKNAAMDVVHEDTEEQAFRDVYSWGSQIGIGTFSVVHEATHRQTGKTYAVKRVPRKDLHPSDAVALHDEIAALQLMTECEDIVRLHDVYDEPDYTFLVLELMRGGDLIDRIIEKRHYTEFDAREVSRKLIMGVAYCHERKIANRNLKPENLLLSAGSDTDVKISDFGYAKMVNFPNSLRTQCGTEGYVAPEILEHRPAYDVSCDMWSLGVIIYIVLGGYRPFRGEGEEVMKQIRYGEYKYHKRYWSHVSQDAKALITSMLTVDPAQRVTAPDALDSPWIQADNESLGTDLSGNMKDLKTLRDAKAKIRGVVNTIIATNKLQSLGGYRAYQDF